MSSLALKFGSLAIRTLSKPIANYIKRQAREHERFRRTCISFAQALHRVDMRLRLGLLQDAAAIEKQAAREAAETKAAKHKHSIPTVKTEAQMKAEEKAAEKAAKEGSEPAKKPPVRIRPLSEAKAVESGATFISETFLFGVAAGLIFFESWRSRRKETSRREDVADRLEELEESEKAARRALVELEREVLRLRAREAKSLKYAETQPQRRILPREIYEVEEKEEKADEEVSKSWLSRIATYISTGNTTDAEAKVALETNGPGPAEKILKQSDAVLEEKHKKSALEAANGVQNETVKVKK